jgi:signal transduction histidine kinase
MEEAKKNSRKISILYILFLFIIFIFIIICLFVAWASFFFYEFNAKRAIDNYANQLDIISNAMAGPSWTVKESYPGVVENILRGVKKQEDIVFIRTIGEDNETIEKSGDQIEVGEKVNHAPSFGRSILIRDEVFNNKKIKGFSVKVRDGTNLWMGISLERIKSNLILVALQVGIFSFIFFTFFIFILYLLFNNIAVKPLFYLINILEKIKNRDYKNIFLKENYIIEVNKVSDSLKNTAVRIEDTEKKLAEEIKRAKELDRMKSEFISIAAHQLRTPLSAVKWTLKMVIDGDLGSLTSEQKTFLMQGYQSNERTIRLVNDFLNVARIEEGRFGLEFSPHKLEDLIDNLLQEFSHVIKEKKIKLTFAKPRENLPQANIDPAKMRLAIQNLIDNAIKYTPEKGEVTITIKYSKLNLEVSIKDSGIGIPKSQQARLFTKFFRSENAIKNQVDGTGLGLFIVKNIIEKHGGKIWVESEENKGAIFSFIVPVIDNNK